MTTPIKEQLEQEKKNLATELSEEDLEKATGGWEPGVHDPPTPYAPLDPTSNPQPLDP